MVEEVSLSAFLEVFFFLGFLPTISVKSFSLSEEEASSEEEVTLILYPSISIDDKSLN